MRVAVIGSGIAGLAAAHALVDRGHRRDRDHRAALPSGDVHVTMLEAASRPGGHVYTVEAHGHAIDMGFIVCNRERYPNFCGLLDELGIATRPTTMSFSVVTPQKIRSDSNFTSGKFRSDSNFRAHEWGSASLDAMFAQRRRILDPRHWRFLVEVVAFLRRARRDLERNRGGQTTREIARDNRSRISRDHLSRTSRDDLSRGSRDDLSRGSRDDLSRAARSGLSSAFDDLSREALDDSLMQASFDESLVGRASLDEYLEARRVSREVRDRFVVPLAAALWSLAPELCGAFPALTYFRFLEQHGMLSPVRPLSWHTVVGGSTRYLDALLTRLRASGRFTLELSTPVRSIVRDARGVSIKTDAGEQRFDRAVIATHANSALGLLAAPSTDERRVLGAFRYSTNRTVLHTDRAFLPRREAAHAAWNYVADPDTARVAVTYSMTKLQGLPDAPYLVTLNPRTEPRGVLHEVTFDHPQLDRVALAAQHELPQLNGTQRTYYAGAHFGFGFHEDGMRSGLEAGRAVLADVARDVAPTAIEESA